MCVNKKIHIVIYLFGVSQATVEVLPRYSTMETVEHRPPGLVDADTSLGVLQASTDTDEVPEGRILSLNSKKLVLDQLKNVGKNVESDGKGDRRPNEAAN